MQITFDQALHECCPISATKNDQVAVFKKSASMQRNGVKQLSKLIYLVILLKVDEEHHFAEGV